MKYRVQEKGFETFETPVEGQSTKRGDETVVDGTVVVGAFDDEGVGGGWVV